MECRVNLFEIKIYGLAQNIYTYHISRYLYEFVYVWLVSALSRADAMLLEQDGYDTNRGGKSGRSSKNKNRNRKKHRPYGKEITYNQALQHLCGGYYKVVFWCLFPFFWFPFSLFLVGVWPSDFFFSQVLWYIHVCFCPSSLLPCTSFSYILTMYSIPPFPSQALEETNLILLSISVQSLLQVY